MVLFCSLFNPYNFIRQSELSYYLWNFVRASYPIANIAAVLNMNMHKDY